MQAQEPNDTSAIAPAAGDTARVQPKPAPIIEGLFLMPVAPGAIVALLDEAAGPQFPPLAFWDSRVAAHIAGGPAFTDSSGGTWAYSAGVEVLWRGIYAEVRDEHFRLPQHIEYRTARLGYLLHPVPEVAGGIALGYRDARGVHGHHGVEISFPFVTGSRTWWLRYEAAYVISSEMVSWNYRMQAEFIVRGGPWYFGGNVEAKTLPLRVGSKVSSVPVTLVLGVRH